MIKTLPGRAGLAISISLAVLLLLIPPHKSIRGSVSQNARTTAPDRAGQISSAQELQRQAADLLARAASSQGKSGLRIF